MKRLLVLIGACIAAAPVELAVAGDVRLATWNLGNLYAVDFVPLRGGAAGRGPEDFERLAGYADVLSADIIGLQEVNSPAAVHRVFDPAIYDVIVDGRREADILAGLKPPAEGGSGATETDGIYIALVTRRDRVTVVSYQDVEALSVMHQEPGEPPRPTRRGIEAVVEVDGRQFLVLVVHLKSSCHQGAISLTSSNPHCRTLARQVPILAGWLHDHTGENVIVLGDWNRRIEVFSATDHLWDPLDAGGNVPSPVDLVRFPFRTGQHENWLASEWVPCPTSAESANGPIDYIAVTSSLAGWGSDWDQIEYSAADVTAADDPGPGTRLSDHCPGQLVLHLP